MASLKTAIDRARVKSGDTDKLLFTDDELIGMVNDILEEIYATLVNIQSNLVYGIGSVATVADTVEYTPSFTTKGGFLRDGSWVDGEDTYLTQVSEADKIKWDYDTSTNQPEAFYVTEGGDIGYLWVPDDAYTIYHTYWVPLTAMATYASDSLPWENIFNSYIQRKLIVEILEASENDGSRQLALSQIDWVNAMNLVYSRGIRQERASSDMFSIEGI
jgi:hypothetical protein